MRKLFALLAAATLVLAACAQEDETTGTQATGGGASCEKDQLNLITAGQLTVGTDDPSFPPWVLRNDPTNGRGFEGAFAYQIAERLGFAESEVDWVVVPFNKSFAPGPKDFDFDINNISVTPEREEGVTFSDGYYDLTQALVAMEGTPIADATTVAELTDYKYGAQVGTTSLAFINEVIQPTEQAAVFDTTNDAKSALENGQIDALVLDLPTAKFVSDVQIPGSVLVGQFPSTGEHLGLLFEKDNPLVTCVNEVLAELKSDGTLEALQMKWLADYLDVPVIQ